jgi:transketolase
MRPIAGPPERSPDPTVSSPSHGAADAAAAPSAVLDWTAADSRAVDPSQPAGLGLSRQHLPVPDQGESRQNGPASADAAALGGYIMAEGTDSEPAVILIALAARDIRQGEGISTRVVSMPCAEWFTAQDASYLEEVLLPRIRARACVCTAEPVAAAARSTLPRLNANVRSEES